MTDQSQTPSQQTQTPSPTQPLGNDPAARNPDGSLKDPTQNSDGKTPPPTEQKTPESNKDEKKDQTPPGAPDKYEPFKLPDTIKLEGEQLASVETLFKGANLSQETAQKFVDYHVGELQKAVQAPTEAFNTMRDGWRKDVINDPTLGNGTELKPEVASTISKGLDALGDVGNKFREAMDQTGLGDHPAIVSAIFALTQRITEGTHVSGKGPSKEGQKASSAPTSAASAIYPHLPSSNR